MLRVLNVNDTLDPKWGGGTAERTFQMTRFLSRQGVQCEVLTIHSEQLDAHRIETLKPAKISVLSCWWRRYNVPRLNWKLIQQSVERADIVHLMGHWSVLNAIVYLAIRRLNKPYVVCPAGALPLFGRSKWLKRFYNVTIGNSIIRNASGWIAVTESEFPQFSKYGIPISRVTVIPNGVSEEDFPAVDIVRFKRQWNLPEAPIILFMGRLNLIKGPDMLLQAYSEARHAFPKYHLVFAGSDGGLLSELHKTIAVGGLSEMVHFLGHVGGEDKSAAYQMASLLVIPSRQEAMSIVALEAGVCGVPVLLTDQCGFGEIRSIDARFEVPASVAGIAGGLTALLTRPESLENLSSIWKSFVERKYAWNSLIPDYIKLYQRILAVAD